MNSLVKLFENKTLGIIGYGREGQSFYHYIRKYFPDSKVFIFEDKKIILNDKNIEVFSLNEWANYKKEVDLFLKSPGIPWSPAFYDENLHLTSQTELFFEYAKGKKIGITGSAGKTSTTSFTYELLKKNNYEVFIGGNFGIPLLDFIDELKEDSITVIELSSYQLKPLKKNPEIAIFLNLYPDHLDYHKTVQDYFESKCNIYRYQSKNDILITDDELLKKLSGVVGEVMTTSNQNKNANAYINEKQIKLLAGDFSLLKFQPRGYGYRSNLGAAILATKAIGLTNEQINRVIPLLNTPPHRLENIGKCQKVQFFNDSISTIPETALHAIKSITEADSIIVGGFDRGLNQDLLVNELHTNQKFLKIVCMGQTGRIIFEALSKELGQKIILTDVLQEAVKAIIQTPNTNCCLFSPGAPSFGLFRNFEERGDCLKEIIKILNVK